MPLDTIASAISRTVSSSILSPNLFQLFQPMGGVRARSAPRHADKGSNAKRTSRFISAIECIACEAVPVGAVLRERCRNQEDRKTFQETDLRCVPDHDHRPAHRRARCRNQEEIAGHWR